MKKFNMAVDGTSGVGKSSVCDIIADKLNMTHLDTGAMYRCVALYLKEGNTNLEDLSAVESALDNVHIRFDGDKVILNDQDVSKTIRTNEVGMMASKTSALAPVRTKLVSLQKEIAAAKGYIVDGRDICSVVLPDAEVKIFMSATAEARAQRRYKEYVSKGMEVDYKQILDDINQRDYQDSHRAISPLKKAEDAIEVDTSELNIEQVVNKILDIIKEKVD
ncbi:MAG: (d)CMP kinase [Firmicutes bacterium]|nr:(d)CMP kinase [Bacillota bacterium]